jgi:tripartite-type tricarboxylate transporter receptor subunit TctC
MQLAAIASGGASVKLPRRKFLHLAAGAAGLPALPRIASALDYPTRPVRIVVGLPAGLAPDFVARLVGQSLSERLGQSFVVENRPGAGSNIGTEIVAKAAPDGYTLLLTFTANEFGKTLYPNLNFDYVRDISQVASIGRAPFVMATNPSLPVKNVPQFIAYAKVNPGKINMASPGNGTSPHVFGELFKMMTGIDMLHVPYSRNYMPDLLAGRVQVAFTGIATVIDYVKDRRLRALAVTTATRVSMLPDLPTIGEFVPGYEASTYNGIGTPRGTPAAVIEKLNVEITGSITDPQMKARLIGLGVEPFALAPAEAQKFVADDTAKWAKVIKFANIKPE